MTNRKVQGVSEEAYQKLFRYIVAKARRYNIPTVYCSDIQVEGWSEEQEQRLHAEVLDAGYILNLKRHQYGRDFPGWVAEKNVPRFGDDAKRKREP